MREQPSAREEETMPPNEAQRDLPEALRKQIFAALVDVQDHGLPVARSRQVIAERFGIREDQVRQVEEEGLDNDWPPFDSPSAAPL